LTSVAGSVALAWDSSGQECERSDSVSEMNSVEQSSVSIGPASPASTTFTPLTQADWIGLDELISSVQASRVSPSAKQVSARAKTTTVTSGRKCARLLHSRDPLGSLLKTLLVSSRWHSTQCSLIWKTTATPRGRLLFRLVASELSTSEIESGLLPTLTAQNYGTNQGGAAGRIGKVRPSLETMARRGLLPTLTVTGNYNVRGMSPTSGDGLGTVLRKLLPTLTARDHRSDSCSPEFRQKRDNLATGKTPWTLGGLLNPRWCESFMGYPPGWTELAPSEMPSSRKSSKKSGGRS